MRGDHTSPCVRSDDRIQQNLEPGWHKLPHAWFSRVGAHLRNIICVALGCFAGSGYNGIAMAKPIARLTKNACGAALAWMRGNSLKSKTDGNLGSPSNEFAV